MLTIRKVTAQDKQALVIVEKKSTPKLQYLPQVFQIFLNDPRGEFMLAELNGEVVACAKFTVLANGTAWLETLRVIPEAQGQGIGKELYKRFFEVAVQESISTIRMYTGLKNVVSKGLAEFSGFELEETFFGFTKDVESGKASEHNFEVLQDANEAVNLIQANPQEFESWNNFAVMNRTFYKVNSEQISYFVDQGLVYKDLTSDSLIICGARFMPEQALHIAYFSGDSKTCLDFADAKAQQVGAKHLSCFLPISAAKTKDLLVKGDFLESPNPFIVMKKG